MNKSRQAYVLKCYRQYCKRMPNSGLGTIYKSWSDEKQSSFDRIKANLQSLFGSQNVDLRCIWGNSSFYTCAAFCCDVKNHNVRFIVFNATRQDGCIINDTGLIDAETGEIFFEF